jgi:hypothetical protein
MIQAGVIDHLQNRMHCTCLWVLGTVYEATDSGMNRRSGAHRARFDCSKQFAVAEAMVTDVSGGFAQSHNFSMSGGIAVGKIAIPSSADHAAFGDDYRADWHFVRLQGTLGAAQGLVHPKLIHLTLVYFFYSIESQVTFGVGSSFLI